MKFHKIISIALLTLAATGAYALEVNRNELQSADSDAIEFENYTGPHSVIDSIEAIKALGTGLGRQVATNPEESASYSLNEKYSVIHAINPDEAQKLDADIILINANATVDHIKNLRRIVAAYLVSAYNYSESDASTLATFITVYNAVYRGNMTYFQSKYKDVVLQYLSEEKVGLSTKWNEWPGKTQIVIPLYDINGGISTIDTSVISDKQVVESIREEDDMGIDERKNLVDIKEREAEQATEKAQEAAQEAADTRQQIQQQQQVQQQAEQNATQKTQEAQQAQQQAQQAQEAAAADPTNQEKQEEAKQAEEVAVEAQKQAEEARQQAAEEAQKTEELKQELAEDLQEAAEQQALADKKQNEAQTERKDIATDQKTVIQEQLAETNPNAIMGLRIVDSSKQLSAMVKVDGATGEIIRESPVNVIRGRTILPVAEEVISSATSAAGEGDQEFTLSSTMYIAICGENNGNGAVKLCLLDANKMEIQKQSYENIAENSVLVQSGTDYYCVIDDNGSYYVGKYDAALKLHLKSSIRVNSATPITVTSRGLLVTAYNGQLVLLGARDLSPVTQLDEVPEK